MSWSEDHPVIITDKERVDVLWSWKSGSEGVNYYRYRLNGGDWVLINAPQRDSGIIEIEVGGTYLIEIQASFDGNTWSESAENMLTTVKVEERSLSSLLKLQLPSPSLLPNTTSIMDMG